MFSNLVSLNLLKSPYKPVDIHDAPELKVRIEFSELRPAFLSVCCASLALSNASGFAIAHFYLPQSATQGDLGLPRKE
jgi:hypothetical protein